MIEIDVGPNLITFGTFILSGLYDIRAKGDRTLRVLLPNVDLTVLLTGSLDLGVQVAGDYNGDNLVDISDYSALLLAFGSLTSALPSADQLLDFNQDDTVDIADYSIVVENFGVAGAAPFGP